MNKKIFLLLPVTLVAGVLTGLFWLSQSRPGGETSEQNTTKTSPSVTLPRVLSTSTESPVGQGHSQIFNDSESNVSSDIQNLNLQENQSVSSPVVIEGEARGSWFSEGQFPVLVIDQEKKILGTGRALTKGEWLTTDFVPFIATVDFNTDVAVGFIVLEKNNPSGQLESRLSVSIPVQFVKKPLAREAGGCKVTGCSSQVCADQEVITGCLYKEEYICFQKAQCERQGSGQCGWTQTKELQQCLEQFGE